MSMHTQRRRVATCAALTHNQTHRHTVPTLVIHYNNGQHVVFTQHHDWAAARREDDMRREKKAEVEAERDRGGERLMEKGRGRDGVGENARATDSVYMLFIFYLNLAGRDISASCQSGTRNWAPGQSNPPLSPNDLSPRQPQDHFSYSVTQRVVMWPWYDKTQKWWERDECAGIVHNSLLRWCQLTSGCKTSSQLSITHHAGWTDLPHTCEVFLSTERDIDRHCVNGRLVWVTVGGQRGDSLPQKQPFWLTTVILQEIQHNLLQLSKTCTTWVACIVHPKIKMLFQTRACERGGASHFPLYAIVLHSIARGPSKHSTHVPLTLLKSRPKLHFYVQY